jgi:hypothetical protein
VVGWAHDTEWTLARAVRRIRQQVIRCCHVVLYAYVWCMRGA